MAWAAIRPYVAAGILASVAYAPAIAGACQLVPLDIGRIKVLMAREVAHRLGLRPAQVPLHALSQPQLHTSGPLQPDCSGVEGYHYTAAFRIGARSAAAGAMPSAQVPMRWPEHAREPLSKAVSRNRQASAEPDADQAHGRWADLRIGAARWPQHQSCVYEGMVALLGYGYSGPVTVNYRRKCRG